MPKRILVDAVYPEETRVVIVDNNRLQEFDYETAVKTQLKGNIYLAKITRVEPSLQAAFVDYGGGKHGFLPFAEIHPDYYQIPTSDKGDGPSDDNSNSTGGNVEDGIAKAIVHLEESGIDTSGEDENEESQPSASSGDDDDEDDNDDNAEVDIIAGEEPYEQSDHHVELNRQYHIQEVIKRGQVLLVQVIKEERGNKGASLTTFISLAGRYCVLMPNTPGAGGVSRKVSNVDDRRRLKGILENLEMPQGTSVIIRTAGSGKTKAEIWRDFDYLVRLWNHIRDMTLSAKAPAFIHAEDDLIKRTIRDMYNSTIDEVLIAGEEAYDSAKGFIKMLMPSHTSNIKAYKGDVPIFLRFQVEEQLAGLYRPEATLDSGGYVVINPTEALIAIDVNSGKATSERNIEETALKTNVEAAKEVARQLRLRDLSGLIVVDFIDMMETKNRRAVERALKDSLQSDRAKIQIGRISPFGLLEMSRQRLRPSFIEANTIECQHCEGRGVIRANESTTVTILRALTNEAFRGGGDLLEVYASNDVVDYIQNFKRADISEIEQRFDITIVFVQDSDVGADGFAIEKKKLRVDKVREAATSVGEALVYAPEEDFEEDDSESDDQKNGNRRKGWKGKKRGSKQSSDGGGEVVPMKGKGRRQPNPRRKNSSKSSGGSGGQRTSNTKRAPAAKSADSEPSLFKGIWKRITK